MKHFNKHMLRLREVSYPQVERAKNESVELPTSKRCCALIDHVCEPTTLSFVTAMTSVNPDVSQYRVGWICAVQTEYTIACALLDYEYTTPPIPPNDENTYTCGRIGEHNVVIACLPKGKYGLTSAANVARDLLRTFHYVTVGLMVGIAGGAPARRDIRLGDVVVGCPTGTYGGVLHYQYGKNVQGKKNLQLTGSLNAPPRQLLSAINKLSAIHEREGHDLDDTIWDLLDRKPRLRQKYSSPGPQRDRLYARDFLHRVEGESCSQCCPSTGTALVNRRHRRTDEDDPQIHYGLIASSDLLMKDAFARDRLSEAKDVLCFEMEAAGLMDHFPCLVIRGICDYSDTHKNDIWQGYAAATAAAYAKELLGVLPATAQQQMPQKPQNTETQQTGLLHLAGPVSGTALIDIIAIHGLGGDAVGSWTDRRQRLWLRDSLPQNIERACIYTYNYDSTQAFCGSLSFLRRAASILLEDLIKWRNEESVRNRSIVFICHGLGGILVKECLKQAQSSSSAGKTVLDSTYGIVFLGTPQQSRMVADWSALLTCMANARSVRSSSRTLLLDSVPQLAKALADVSRTRYSFLDSCSILSFYERDVLQDIGRLVVPKTLAISGTSRERSIALAANHWAMATLSSDAVEASAKVHSEIKDLVAEALSDNFNKGLRTELLQKLYCFDYESILANIPEAITGTGQWLHKTQQFQDWANHIEPRILYMRGPPGFGKSVAAAKLIHDFRSGKLSIAKSEDSQTLTIAYYFFGKSNPEANSQAIFLRSILHQIIQQCPMLADTVQSRLDNSADTYGRGYIEPHTQINALWKALEGALAFRSPRAILLVIDALDEVSERDLEQVSNSMMRIVRSLNSGSLGRYVKVLLTSRPHEIIVRQFWDYTRVTWEKEVNCVDMDEDEMSADVKAFLDIAVTEYGHENGFPATTITNIIDAISQRAGGMFLWSSLAWEDFKKGIVIWKDRIIQQRLDELEKLPRGIESLYANLISKIDPDAWKELNLLVTNMLVAPHPLTCDEAGQMLGIHGDEVNTDQIDAPFSIQQIIATHCPTLLIINPGGVIQFVHLSLQEYLRKTHKQGIERLHTKIAELCIHYLNLQDIREAADSDFRNDEHSDCLLQSRRFGFYNYAATCLDFHMRHVQRDDDIWLRYAKLARNYEIYHVIRNVSHESHTRPQRWKKEAPEYCVYTPLYTALEMGAFDLIAKFAAIGYNLEEKWCLPFFESRISVTTAMHKYINNSEAVQKLLECGMSPNVTDSEGRTPLHLAAWGKWNESLRILLKSPRLDVNVQDAEGKTALHYEASSSNTSIILSDSRVDLAITDKQKRTAIACAAFWGNFAMVSDMVQKSGPSMWSYHPGDLSPLVAAAQLDWKDLTISILEKVSDINSHQNYNGRNIVHVAVRNDWMDVVQRALDLGADVNAVDNSGKTALHLAAELGSYQVCRQLLRFGATARIQDSLGRTPVHAAAVEGFADTLLPLMMESDYDINAVDHQRRSVVHWAATCDYARIMRLVIETANVDLLRKDHYGRTALHTAAICGCPNVITTMLESGEFTVADVDNFGNTALHLAARGGSLSTLEILLPKLEYHRHRVNTRGQTALDTAYVYRCGAEVIGLLERWGLRRQIKPTLEQKVERPLYGADANWFDLVAGEWNAIAVNDDRAEEREKEAYASDDERPGNVTDDGGHRRRDRYSPSNSPRPRSRYDESGDDSHDDRYEKEYTYRRSPTSDRPRKYSNSRDYLDVNEADRYRRRSGSDHKHRRSRDEDRRKSGNDGLHEADIRRNQYGM